MTKKERSVAILTFSLTGISGVLIFILKEWGTSAGPFGPVQHHLLKEVVLIHNLLNLSYLIVLGWLASIHIMPKLRLTATDRKRSGLTLLIIFLLIPISGQILLYLSDKNILELSRTIHLIFGLTGLLFLYIHSRKKKAFS